MAKDRSESKLFAFLGVVPVIGFLLVLLLRKNDSYARFYGRQGLIIFLAWAVGSIVGLVVPIIGWFIIMPAVHVLTLVLWILALVNSVSGQKKPTPLIGKWADKLGL